MIGKAHALKDILSQDISCGQHQDPDSSAATCYYITALDDDGGGSPMLDRQSAHSGQSRGALALHVA
ncbi:hypothetical protein B9Z55_019535 [Caenorhabditis nigoni]|uniref:Uncharacterized protein n=1 Tax=Caenorhabditis nigoni TaxID=1611254 RepID=A0A2G5TIX6_9PELO|nr:hypothetical protein B9Z55_019535 [Caenorhabditis nigoni]